VKISLLAPRFASKLDFNHESLNVHSSGLILRRLTRPLARLGTRRPARMAVAARPFDKALVQRLDPEIICARP